MVVEDEPDIYEVLLAMFEMWGIEGAAFVDGEEAVAWIDDADKGFAPGELPELALLDIRLPGNISGPAVGERLRKSPPLSNVAIVLITAYKLSPEAEKKVIEEAGADRLLYKPLPKFHELKRILEDVIADRRARAQRAAAESLAQNSAVQNSDAPTAEAEKIPPSAASSASTPASSGGEK
jgi:CheY-like chemotaxis protein